jgi:hypothetical protein
MPTTVNREITAEEVQHALSETLGPHYKVTAKSDTRLHVTHNIGLATVHISWSPGQTSFQVHGHGIVVLRALDALTITPKVRHALEHAFPNAA